MTAPDHDEEFEVFLKRRTLLPDMADRLEPPAELDAQVLNQARKAIHAQQRPVRAARWARPVALAATILLCLSIVLNVTLNTNRRSAYAERATAASNDKAPGQAAAPSAPAAPAPANSSTEALQGGGAAEPQAFAAAPRASSSQTRSGPVADTPGYSADALTKPDAPPLMARSGSPALAPPPPPSANARGPGRAGLSQSAPPDGAGTPASTSERQVAEQSRDEASQAPSEVAATGSSLEALKPSALAKRKSEAQPPPHPQDPKVWLQQIEALRAQGRTAQADAEMQRFRAAFPDYPAKPGDSGIH